MKNNIISISVIDRNENSHVIEAPTDMGLNLMEVIKSFEFPVEGTCGGMALCASCHSYILSQHVLKERSDDEENMLDQAFFVEDNSRLICQIKLDNSMDGLIVKLAPEDESNLI